MTATQFEHTSPAVAKDDKGRRAPASVRARTATRQRSRKMSRPETSAKPAEREPPAAPVTLEEQLAKADVALQRAAQAVEKYDEAIMRALTGTRDESLEALELIYELCASVEPEEVRTAWITRHGVKVHGNVKNPLQPVVKTALAEGTHGNKKSKLRLEANRFAAACAEAIDRKVPIGEFAQAVKQTPDGLEGLAKAWRQKQARPENKVEREREREELIADFMDEITDAPTTFAGYDGLIIAALEIKEGELDEWRVLEADPAKARAIVERYARRAQQAGES